MGGKAVEQILQWVAAEVVSGREREFAEAVGEKFGVEAYTPMRQVTTWSRRARKWRHRSQPMLTGYVLLHSGLCPPDRELMAAAPLARGRLLRNALGEPSHVAQYEIVRLQVEEASGEFNSDPRELQLKFVRGEIYVIRQGSMSGAEVQCDRPPRRGDFKGDFNLGGLRMKVPLCLFAGVM